MSFLGSTGAGWPQQPSKYEIDTVSYVNTLLHTFNQTTVRGVHRRRELVAPVHERARQAAMDSNDRTHVLPGLPQFFPSANPDNLLPQASFTGGTPGNDRGRSTSNSGGRSSATTGCGTSRAT